MKIKKINYLGLKYEEVCKKFEGDLKFINYVSIKEFNGPMACYHNSNPNRQKSHKDYLLLFQDIGGLKVTGIDKHEITDEERYRIAIYCTDCNELIYSVYRHDFNECSCGRAFADGGQYYSRVGGDYKLYKIDIFEDKIIT